MISNLLKMGVVIVVLSIPAWGDASNSQCPCQCQDVTCCRPDDNKPAPPRPCGNGPVDIWVETELYALNCGPIKQKAPIEMYKWTRQGENRYTVPHRGIKDAGTHGMGSLLGSEVGVMCDHLEYSFAYERWTDYPECVEAVKMYPLPEPKEGKPCE